MAVSLSLGSFLEKIIILYIYNFPDASEVFKDTMIKGGVNYFLYDKSYSGDVKFETKIGATHTTSTRPLFINDMNIILYDDMQISFINKLNNVGYESMTNITTGRNPFGIQGKESNVI